MSKSYKSERDLKEKQKLFKLGVVGIPFSHSTSIQGNPMRSGDFKSSSKYHKHCSKEPWSESNNLCFSFSILFDHINKNKILFDINTTQRQLYIAKTFQQTTVNCWYNKVRGDLDCGGVVGGDTEWWSSRIQELGSGEETVIDAGAEPVLHQRSLAVQLPHASIAVLYNNNKIILMNK